MSALLKQTLTVEQPLMMRGVNRETMLTNNQHNQLAVACKGGCEPDIILVKFFFFFFFSSVLLLLFAQSFSPCLSVSLSQSLSLPTLRSRLLGFLAEHRDQRKGKKKTEGRIYEGHPC